MLGWLKWRPYVTVLVKGSRFMRMERVVDGSSNGERLSTHGRALMLLLDLTQWLATEVRTFNVFNYITLRAVLATLTGAGDLLRGRPGDDPQADCVQDRAVGARRRPAEPLI